MTEIADSSSFEAQLGLERVGGVQTYDIIIDNSLGLDDKTEIVAAYLSGPTFGRFSLGEVRKGEILNWNAPGSEMSHIALIIVWRGSDGQAHHSQFLYGQNNLPIRQLTLRFTTSDKVVPGKTLEFDWGSTTT